MPAQAPGPAHATAPMTPRDADHPALPDHCAEYSHAQPLGGAVQPVGARVGGCPSPRPQSQHLPCAVRQPAGGHTQASPAAAAACPLPASSPSLATALHDAQPSWLCAMRWRSPASTDSLLLQSARAQARPGTQSPQAEAGPCLAPESSPGGAAHWDGCMCAAIASIRCYMSVHKVGHDG